MALITTLVTLSVILPSVFGHGYMMQPAQRSSAFRYGFPVPANFNDNQLFCGGFGVQWNQQNDGQCGACGDAFSDVIKPNEDIGGRYVTGVITGEYEAGSVMEVKILITAYHKGWFEFRLCPLASPTTKVTQACLNQTILSEPGTGIQRFFIESIPPASTGVFTFNLQLPAGLTCTNCVLQWWYNTGNSFGCERGGICGVGLGKQESYRNCADIKINPTNGQITPFVNEGSVIQDDGVVVDDDVNDTPTVDDAPTNEAPVNDAPVNDVQVNDAPVNVPATITGIVVSCVIVPPYNTIAGMNRWCIDNCNAGNCPANICDCIFQ